MNLKMNDDLKNKVNFCSNATDISLEKHLNRSPAPLSWRLFLEKVYASLGRPSNLVEQQSLK